MISILLSDMVYMGHRALPENMDMKETCFRVLGADMIMPMTVAMAEKATVHKE
jgi:hypothetical protein